MLFIPIVVMADATSTESNSILLQWIVNVLFTLVGALGAYVLNSLQKEIKESKILNAILDNKIHLLEVLVAGQYVKKDELEKLSVALFRKLDRIESKLDNKVDKV